MAARADWQRLMLPIHTATTFYDDNTSECYADQGVRERPGSDNWELTLTSSEDHFQFIRWGSPAILDNTKLKAIRKSAMTGALMKCPNVCSHMGQGCNVVDRVNWYGAMIVIGAKGSDFRDLAIRDPSHRD